LRFLPQFATVRRISCIARPHNDPSSRQQLGSVAKSQKSPSHEACTVYCMVRGCTQHGSHRSSGKRSGVGRGEATLGADRQPPAIGRRNARDTLTLRWIFRSVPQA
jgi:hypothetical protein